MFYERKCASCEKIYFMRETIDRTTELKTYIFNSCNFVTKTYFEMRQRGGEKNESKRHTQRERERDINRDKFVLIAVFRR